MAMDSGAAAGPQRLGHGRSSEVFLEGPDRVLKLYRAGSDPAAIAAEFQAVERAAAFGLPVARALARVERDGRSGILFEHVPGPTLLRAHAGRPLALVGALADLARLQARIHACPADGLPDLHDALAREIARARLSEATRAAALDALARRPRGQALCHGDLHPDNVIWTADGPRVIDWQKAMAGPPAADVARTVLMIRRGRTGDEVGRFSASGAARDLAAGWYAWRYAAAAGLPLRAFAAEVSAWRLPFLAARLAGQPAESEAAVRAEADRLAAPRGSATPAAGLAASLGLWPGFAAALSDLAAFDGFLP
ncbi:aminoglycoside phosphotransferase family protein [Methylobacterium sp. A54F]